MKIKLPVMPTVLAVLAVITLTALGTWQVQRLMSKNKIINDINTKISLAAVIMPYGNIGIDDFKYRIVKIEGHFLHDKEVHLFTGARSIGGEPGYNILTPMKRNDGSVVLVDRGWVPANKKEKGSRQETLLKGELEIKGIVLAGEKQGLFTPQNNIIKNIWFWVDMPAISAFTGNTHDSMYVRELANGDKTDVLPIKGDSNIKIRNDHLEYAIIWYSLAVAQLIIYLIYIRKQLKYKHKINKA